MQEKFLAYLAYLNHLRQGLEVLTTLAEKKIAAVRADDLTALNEVMNEEQAQALHFRGLEITREKLQKELGLVGVPLSQLPGRCPPELAEDFRSAALALRERCLAYRKQSTLARRILENETHEIETIIAGLGGAPAQAGTGGPGYRPPQSPEPPKSMKTDFRA